MDWNTHSPSITYRDRYWNWAGENLVDGYTEYASIAKDPEIGSLPKMDDPRAIPLAVACHELAHAICIWNWHKGGEKDRLCDPHGCEWRWTYRQLRRHFCLVLPIA